MHKNKAVNIVLAHNRLQQTVKVVELLLEGKTQKDIVTSLGVTQAWVSKVNKKYLKEVLL